MEPIRPDDDELRGKSPEQIKAPAAAETKPKPAAKSAAGKSEKSGDKPTQGKAVWLLSLVLLGAVILGGAVWLQQERRIAALEGQLEEADYWARQSKLALARFEGELSQTGESLEETGASMGEQLDAHSSRLAGHDNRLDTADSEIRKLWVVANERNKQQLVAHGEHIGALEASLGEQSELLTALGSDIENQGRQLTRKVDGLGERVSSQGEQLSSRLGELGEQVAGVNAVVESRLQRFVQERRLADEEVRTRLQAVERQLGQQADAGELERTRARLAELEQTVKAIDSSRAQLTSRLVRLSSEVDALRRQTTAQ